jgi:uncharacterized protein (TIGR02246 family)
MRTVLFSFVLLFAFNLFSASASAQAYGQAAFEDLLKKVYDAYQRGDNDAMWAYYTDQASEISPDGHLASGKAALKAGWDEFMKMADEKPAFTFQLTSWRLITPEVALITWDSNADIKIQGRQVGGPSICVAVLHKIDGEWKIEFDGMTPVIQMPAGN